MKVKLYKNYEHWYHGGVIWFYSDPHFQKDTEMEQYFGWPTAEERLQRINERVTKNDTFVCLGDVGDRLDLIAQIKCSYKVLFTGNHDSGESNYRRRDVWTDYPFDTEEEAKEQLKVPRHIFRLGVVKPDKYISTTVNGEEKYQLIRDNRLFDEVYDGPQFINNKIVVSHEKFCTPFAMNIHGHEHGGVFATEKQYVTEQGTFTSYLINVAADVNNFYPIRLDEIVEQFPLKYIKSIHEATIEDATRRKEERK